MGALTDPSTTRIGASRIVVEKKTFWQKLIPRMITTETYMPHLREFAAFDPTINIAKLEKLEKASKIAVIAGTALITGAALAGPAGVAGVKTAVASAGGVTGIAKAIGYVPGAAGSYLGIPDPDVKPDVEPLSGSNILLYAGMGLVALLLIPMLFKKKQRS